MLTLRPYQQDAKEAVYRHLHSRDDNPCVVIPTAGGKTPVMASICKDAVTLWGGRVLVLAHVKELLEQTADKLTQVCSEVKFGIYSASLKRRDTEESVIIAGIQSVFRRACELDRFDLVIVDEAHLISPDGEGMYQTFLGEARVVNPALRVIGFTATPFRLKDGPLCTPEGILNQVCYEVGVRELIRDGFLCPLVTKSGINKVDTSQLHLRAGEFVADEVEQLMDHDQLVASACGEIVAYASERNAVLIFASGIRHGQHVVRVLAEQHRLECGFVTGETPVAERDAILKRFRAGQLKYLCNVNVLTTGFDAPHIDCVVLLRPTASAGLYYQMVGRGFRLHESKRDCLVLDFGGNVLRHGPVDTLRAMEKGATGGSAPAKECPECFALVATGYAICPQCGYRFPPPQRQQHEAQATSAGILSGQETTTKHRVKDVRFYVHTKRGAMDDAPKTLRVEYQIGLNSSISEYICFEHQNFARQHAIDWWQKRSPDPVPATSERAIEIIEGGGLCHTVGITTKKIAGERFERIIDYELGPMPDPLPEHDMSNPDGDEIPF